MAIEKAPASYVDIVDRVLDKGIVVDATMRIAVAGIDLMTIESPMVVASIDTYLERFAPLDDLLPKNDTSNVQR